MPKIIYSSQEKYLESFISKPDGLLGEMEMFAFENKIPILHRHAAEVLEQFIFLSRPNRVLEIGTAIGYSTIRIASLLKKKSMIDTIEKSDDNIPIAENYFERSGLNKKINLIKGDACQIMPSLKRKYDFIFLDADKEDYEKLFFYSLMLLKKRGVMFVDNLLWHGFVAAAKIPPKYKDSTNHIKEFNKLFLSNDALMSSIIPVGDGIGIGIKK